MIDVVTAHRPPLVFVDGGGNGSSTRPIFTGFLVDLLPTLLQVSGINDTYQLYDFAGGGGALLSNGSWSGVMGQLVSGAADMALFPLTLTSQRALYIQHTTAYMDDGYGMLVHVREVDPGYSFLMPFSGRTWLCFLAALFGVVLMLTILDSVTRRARLKAVERTQGVMKSQQRRRRDKMMGHAIETIMMSVGSGAAPTSRSWSVKIMFIAWAIFSVIMLSAYTANLTAHLTVNQIGVPIRSLSDLADAAQPFGVPADSSVAAYFKNSSDQGARSLRPKMVEYKTTAAGAEAVREGHIAAFICDYPVAQFFTQEPPCDLALGTETVGSGALVLGLSPNSTLTNALNMGLLQLSEAGYLAELRRKWFVEASQCAAGQDSDANGSGRLSMAQAWSVFTILGAGIALSIIAAALEVLYYKKLFRGIHALKEDVSRLGPRATLKKRFSRCKSVRFSEQQLAGLVLPAEGPQLDDDGSSSCSSYHSAYHSAFQSKQQHHAAAGSGKDCQLPPVAAAAAGGGGGGGGGGRHTCANGLHRPPAAAAAGACQDQHQHHQHHQGGGGAHPGGSSDRAAEYPHHQQQQQQHAEQQQQQHSEQQQSSPFLDVQRHQRPVSLFARASGAVAAAGSRIRSGIDRHLAAPESSCSSRGSRGNRAVAGGGAAAGGGGAGADLESQYSLGTMTTQSSEYSHDEDDHQDYHDR